ncbi:MAG TPA: VWA domain-containing protein [Candidatus Acidoferrales bacterium]|nr:VWA domain-containing protein [Candidatus Acidoferrales bacterium]
MIWRWLWLAFVFLIAALAGKGTSQDFISQTSDATGQSQNQNPQAEGTQPLRVDVKLALVNATVKDMAGRVMDGLTRDDFVVEDDGETQKISYLSHDQLPLAVALVVDISRSTDPYIEQLDHSTITALRALKPEDEVALFTFADSVDCRVDLTKNKELISDSFKSIKFDQGGTNISRAVYDAGEYLKRNAGPAQRVIVLISDDVPTGADLRTEEVVRATLEANAPVYNLKIAGNNPAEVQRVARGPNMIDVGKLTALTGGEIFDVNSKDGLLPAFQALIQLLKSRYTIGFYPADPSQSAPHVLSVSLQPQFGQAGNDYRLTATAGPHYYTELTNEEGREETSGLFVPDPALFRTLPLDKWLAEKDQAQIPWKLNVRSAGLTVYQRLSARVSFRFDGREIYKRGADGDIAFALRFTDSAEHQFDFGGEIEIARIYRATLPQMNLTYSVDAFVLPGTYEVSIIAYHTATHERTIAHRTLEVAPLAGDPLPQLWQSFPEVEFVHETRRPAAWLAPEITETFNASVNTLRPLRVDIIAETNPDMWILPALKIFSQISFNNGSAGATVIDYGRGEVSFEQPDLHHLEWSALESSLPLWEPKSPLTKDDADFLRTELVRILSGTGDASGSSATARHVFVVLTGPTNFDDKADISGIKLDRPCDCSVYMIRFPISVGLRLFQERAGLLHLQQGSSTLNFQLTSPLRDGLEKMVEPLNPKVFVVNSPLDFRRALAIVLADLSSK